MAVPAAAGEYLADGTYTGSGSGFNGAVRIGVTIQSGRITEIKEVSQEEDYWYAFTAIQKQIIEKQSVDVDTVSGATYTSRGVINAVKDALAQAKKQEIFSVSISRDQAALAEGQELVLTA